jgi:hypothetical protein
MSDSKLVFHWTIAPERMMIPNLIKYQLKVQVALRSLFATFAAKIEAYARRAAPWTDRSGDARRGLTGWSEGEGFNLIIYLATTVAYGVYLELGTRYMAPRPIVVPALQAHYAELVAAIGAIIAGL